MLPEEVDKPVVVELQHVTMDLDLLTGPSLVCQLEQAVEGARRDAGTVLTDATGAYVTTCSHDINGSA